MVGDIADKGYINYKLPSSKEDLRVTKSS